MGYKRSLLMEERLADNRQRILKAARALVAEGGFNHASIGAVAASAGLSAGAIYRYFPSKAALFVEVLTSAIDHEIAILQDIAKSEANVTVRLR
ncbi:MAG: helix-turn-helix domain-containing protein, partial [Pseudomonadota bacterium]|nr:helix-turn-helix domain-containing protein [Pseudomonadota bacterium]